MPVMLKQVAESKRRDDVEMPNEELQPHSLVDFDYCSDMDEEQEEEQEEDFESNGLKNYKQIGLISAEDNISIYIL